MFKTYNTSERKQRKTRTRPKEKIEATYKHMVEG
jgi:hypothetical protein